MSKIKVGRISIDRSQNGLLVADALVQQLPGKLAAFCRGHHLSTGKQLDQALKVCCIIIEGGGRR